MENHAEVLAANAAFYRVFAAADADGMAKIWAVDRDELTVVHPGAVAVSGRAQVLDTWRTIFDDASHVDIRCTGAQAYIHGDMAIVLCTEIVQGHRLAATNVFCRSADGWCLVHHQAGPCHVAPDGPPPHKPVLH